MDPENDPIMFYEKKFKLRQEEWEKKTEQQHPKTILKLYKIYS